jgi:uncharacterized protein (DUF3084 family)
VKVTDHSEKPETERKAANQRVYGAKRERTKATKTQPVTEAQLRYLSSLIIRVSKDRLNAEFTAAIKGTSIAPRR